LRDEEQRADAAGSTLAEHGMRKPPASRATPLERTPRSVRPSGRGYVWGVPLRVWVIVAALTGLAVVVTVAPLPRLSDAVVFALVAADLVAIGLIAGDVRALWAAVAYATCLCVAWYVVLFATDADSGILDGVIIGLFALVIASAAVATGVLVGRGLR
jgi:hypothetical protein